MSFFNRKKPKTDLCPNCRMPIGNSAVFCESCGFRLSPPPACAGCQIPLAPDTNFCESCGTPVTADPPSPPPLPPAREPREQEPPEHDPAPRGKKGRKRSHHSRGNHEPPRNGPSGQGQYQDPCDSPVYHPPGRRPVSLFTRIRGRIAGISPRVAALAGSRRNRAIAVIAAACIILAVVLTPSISRLVGSSAAAMAGPGPVSPAVPVMTTHAPAAEEAVYPPLTPTPVITSAKAARIEPGETQVPPRRLQVDFQAERDPVSHLVTVTFMGGLGTYGVEKVETRLTRSDGQVLTEYFRPAAVGSSVSLQGTLFTDRLEVIVHYYAGGQYTVIDKVFEYKKRN